MRNLNSPKYLVESFPLNGHNSGIKSTATPTAQTWTSDRWNRGIAYFTNGGLAWSSLSFTSYEYMYDGTHYIFDGTNTYTNGVLTGSKPITITTTGFSGVTAAMGRIKLYNVVITPEEVSQRYKAAITQIPNSFDIEQPYPTIPDLTDPNLVGAWLNPETVGAKDASANGKDATVTNCRFNRDKSAVFANGDFTITSTSFDTYGYWHRATDSGEWKLYISNDGTVYTNLIATGSMPVAFGATGFTGQTCQLRDIRFYTGSLTAAQMMRWFNAGVPDSKLVLSVDGQGFDKSRYKNVCTPYGGAKIGGRRLKFSQDGCLDCGSGTALNPGTQDFWWSFWVKFGSGTDTYNTLVINGASGGTTAGTWVRRYNINKTLEVMVCDGSATRIEGAVSGAILLDDGAWRKIDIIYDRDVGAYAFVNGVLQSGYILDITPQQGFITNSMPTRVGGYSIGLHRLNGWMDRVKCQIGRLPTAAEILRNYNNEKKYY